MGHALHVAEKSPSRSPGRTSSHTPLITRQAALTSQGILQPKTDRCACGGSCPRCREQSPLQKKLSISEPGDPYEQEADRVADEVMRTPVHPAGSGAAPYIQRFTGHATGQVDTAPASVDSALASPGRPLEPALRQDMEQRFGHDFSSVRIHSGAAAERSARDVNAQAYTVGHDVVFGAGRFAPGTNEGRRLIAHELTHVVQQSGADGVRFGQSDEKRGLSPIPPMFASKISKKTASSGTSTNLFFAPVQVQKAEGDAESCDAWETDPHSMTHKVVNQHVQQTLGQKDVRLESLGNCELWNPSKKEWGCDFVLSNGKKGTTFIIAARNRVRVQINRHPESGNDACFYNYTCNAKNEITFTVDNCVSED